MLKSVHTPEYQSLRRELADARSRAGLSQRDLAARLAVPHSWVAKVESGERRIDVVEVCRYFAACGVSPVAPLTRLSKHFPLHRQVAARGAR